MAQCCSEKRDKYFKYRKMDILQFINVANMNNGFLMDFLLATFYFLLYIQATYKQLAET